MFGWFKKSKNKKPLTDDRQAQRVEELKKEGYKDAGEFKGADGQTIKVMAKDPEYR